MQYCIFVCIVQLVEHVHPFFKGGSARTTNKRVCRFRDTHVVFPHPLSLGARPNTTLLQERDVVFAFFPGNILIVHTTNPLQQLQSSLKRKAI